MSDSNPPSEPRQLSFLDGYEIPLTKGKIAIVDLEDSDLAKFNWYCSIYAIRFVNRKQLQLHRVILARKLGRELIADEQVDHINGDKLDNRRSNLRSATNAQNVQNLWLRRSNTSGYKGIYFNKIAHYWEAQIYANKKRYWLGAFATAEEAYKAYCEAAKKYHGEFARLKE